MAKQKKEKGAQPGNQNARKHGFYSKYLSGFTLEDVQRVAEMEGLEAEIGVIRLKLRDLIENSPDNSTIQLEAVRALAYLVKTQFQVTEEQGKPLRDAAAKVLSEIAGPLNLDIKP